MREPTLLRYISILYRYSQIHITRKVKPLGIGSGHHPFILAVCRFPGISQDGLSEELVMDKGTTAKAVKTLVESGFIERERDMNDRRVYRLYATAKGEELGKTLDTIILEWRNVLWTGLTEEEKKEAHSLSARMAKNAKDYLERPR